jgi:5-formyltetrahydrofolate cyclo-ligase
MAMTAQAGGAAFSLAMPALSVSLLDVRKQLRSELRRQRNAVPPRERQAASQAVARHLQQAKLLRRGQRVAIYDAFDGELDLAPVLRAAKRIGCLLYRPKVVSLRSRRMEFVALAEPAAELRASKSWLAPARVNFRQRVDPRALDLVLVPLVAYDVHGWRLGFGAGFYDRKFRFRRTRPLPKLFGVAYDFQRVPAQVAASWDVLLDGVVTPTGLQRSRPLSASPSVEI